MDQSDVVMKSKFEAWKEKGSEKYIPIQADSLTSVTLHSPLLGCWVKESEGI
jgi:hypothetical protein